MSRKTKLLLFAVAVSALTVIVLTSWILTSPPPPLPPFPNPNGFDDFVKAAQLVPQKPPDYQKLTAEELRVLVATDAAALQLARTGLSRTCRVRLDYSAASRAHLDELHGIKALGLAFAAEGRLAEMENRPADAAASYLDTIHLGNESARGGVLIDQLIGTTMEAIGTSQLQNLVDRLDVKSCRETTSTLELLDSQRQSWADVLQQERNWSRRAFPSLRYRLVELFMHNSLKKALQKAELKFKERQTKTRQLLIDLAARAFELEKGHRPSKLADLAPDFLKAIPKDPATGKDMTYTR